MPLEQSVHERQDYRTPSIIYNKLVPVLFDTPDRHDGAFDALHDPWPQPWFCNPPYGREIVGFTARMRGDGIALLPARVDTQWFHADVFGQADELFFPRGRLCFNDLPHGSKFPSVFAFYAQDPDRGLSDVVKAGRYHVWQTFRGKSVLL